MPDIDREAAAYKVKQAIIRLEDLAEYLRGDNATEQDMVVRGELDQMIERLQDVKTEWLADRLEPRTEPGGRGDFSGGLKLRADRDIYEW
jgi:hypothetical protein